MDKTPFSIWEAMKQIQTKKVRNEDTRKKTKKKK